MTTYYISNNEVKFAEANRLLMDSRRTFELRDLPTSKIWSQDTAESESILETSAKEDVVSACNTLKAPCFLERRWVKLDSGKK